LGQKYSIFDEFLDGIFIINEGKQIIYLNQMAALLFQLSAKRVLNKPCFDHFIFDKQDLFCMPEGTLGKDAPSQYHEVSFSSPKGASGFVRVMIQPDLLTEEEKRWIVYFHDVTEEKNLSGKYKSESQQKQKAVDTIFKIQDDLKEVTTMALKDEMTGLNNFRAFNRHLVDELQNSLKSGLPLGLVILDVDKFKVFNDTYGHQQGDEVLRHVAQTYQKNVRGTDIVARYGGEEFVLILPKTDEKGVLTVSEKVRQAVQETKVPYLARPGEFLTVTASFGGLAIYPEDIQKHNISDQKILIEAADKNLYQAKEQGRNRVIVKRWRPED
jgi:diguanylate cyclase (GGDEF)-like protein